MKRKIAVFTNGWNDDYLDFALEGIRGARLRTISMCTSSWTILPTISPRMS